MLGAFITVSGIPARITLGCNASPDHFFFIGGHEYPFGDFSHRATATPANIIEGGRTYGNTGRIRTFGDGLHHRVETQDMSFIHTHSDDALRGVQQAGLRTGFKLCCFFCVTYLHQLG